MKKVKIAQGEPLSDALSQHDTATLLNAYNWPEGTMLTVHGEPGGGWTPDAPMFTVECGATRLTIRVGGKYEVTG